MTYLLTPFWVAFDFCIDFDEKMIENIRKRLYSYPFVFKTLAAAIIQSFSDVSFDKNAKKTKCEVNVFSVR